MAKFEIIELDRDYRVVTDTYFKNFSSKKLADEYCRKQSWTGFQYFAKEIKNG